MVCENPLGPEIRTAAGAVAGAPSTLTVNTALDIGVRNRRLDGNVRLRDRDRLCVGERRIARQAIANRSRGDLVLAGLEIRDDFSRGDYARVVVWTRHVICAATPVGRPTIVSDSFPVRGAFESQEAKSATEATSSVTTLQPANVRQNPIEARRHRALGDSNQWNACAHASFSAGRTRR